MNATHTDSITRDINVVEIWLRKDPKRWIAGVMAGIFAGTVALAVAMIIAVVAGHEIWYPAKLMATGLLGPSATVTGFNLGPILAGIIVLDLICVFWGFVYAHFTGTNNMNALLAMGVVWGTFSWIFVWNLFLQSVKPINWAHIPPSAAFPVCLAYGLSLASVAFFDRAMGGSMAAHAKITETKI